MVLFINRDNNRTDSQSSVYLKWQAQRFFNRGKHISDHSPLRCNQENRSSRCLKSSFRNESEGGFLEG